LGFWGATLTGFCRFFVQLRIADKVLCGKKAQSLFVKDFAKIILFCAQRNRLMEYYEGCFELGPYYFVWIIDFRG